MRLAGEVIEEVRQPEVGLIAHRHHMAEADTTLGGGAGQGARERATVGDESHVTEMLLLDERAAVGGELVRVIDKA